jgi:hypothetical protein
MCTVRRVFTNTTGIFIETLAGMAGCGYATGNFTTARFANVTALALNPDRTRLFAADITNAVVYSLDLVSRNVSIVAGIQGSPGNSTDGPALNSSLNAPNALAVASWGDLYIGLSGSRTIVRVSNGNLLRVAGSGACATALHCMDWYHFWSATAWHTWLSFLHARC